MRVLPSRWREGLGLVCVLEGEANFAPIAVVDVVLACPRAAIVLAFRKAISIMLRRLFLFMLMPFVLLMNTCSMIMDDIQDTTSSGALSADAVLLNGGAMSDYSGAVWVHPRFLPRIWPLYQMVSCRALVFESDPSIQLRWIGKTLQIEHDRFVSEVIKNGRCYGRTVVFRERPAQE